MYFQIKCPPLPYFVIAGETLFRPGDVHERRVLKDVYDFIVVVNGRLYIQDEKDRYSMGTNEFLILAPDRLHYGYRPCDEDTKIDWFHFKVPYQVNRVSQLKIEIRKKSNRKKYYKKDPFNLYLPVRGCLSDQDRSAFIQNLSDLSDVDVNHKLREKRFLQPQVDPLTEQQLFLKILSIIYIKSSVSHQDNLAAQVYSYLELHYDQPFSLEKLANHFMYSKPYIIESMKKNYHQTPQRIHRQIRLENAERMLVETPLSVDEISERLSYSSTSYFIRQFKSQYKETPLEYRKNH